MDIIKYINTTVSKNDLITYDLNLAHYLKDINATVFLSCLVMWAKQENNEDGCVHKSDEDIKEYLNLSGKEIRRIKKVLENENLIETVAVEADNAGYPVSCYKLNPERLREVLICGRDEREKKDCGRKKGA